MRSQPDAALAAYLDGIGRHPLLSPGEERTLTEEYARTADPAVAQRLAQANLRLVVKIAKGYHGRGASLLDLIQEGNIGLLEGIRRYDPRRGPRLASYASFWIRAHILQHLMATSGIVRGGRTRAQRASFLRGEQPPADLSLDDAFPHEDLDAVKMAGDEHLSGVAPDEVVAAREALRLLRERLGSLSLDARERLLLQERMLAEEPVRLSDIGRRLAVSGEAVRQLEQKLVGRLREEMATPAAA